MVAVGAGVGEKPVDLHSDVNVLRRAASAEDEAIGISSCVLSSDK